MRSEIVHIEGAYRGSAARNLSFVRGCDARVHRVNVHGHDRAADNRFYEQLGSACMARGRAADPTKMRVRAIRMPAIGLSKMSERVSGAGGGDSVVACLLVVITN